MRCPNRTSRQTPAASPWLSQLVLSLPNQNLRGSGVASRRRRRRSNGALFDLGEADLEACGQGERWQGGADRETEQDDGKIQGRAGDPTGEGGPPPARRGFEEVGARIGPAAHGERLRDHDPQERHEKPADQEQEQLVGAADALARYDEVPAAAIPRRDAATIVAAWRRRGERFWTETAAEYTSAKALSVSSTKIAINGRAPRPRTLRVIRKA